MADYLRRDQILGAADLPREDVYVPEWGGTVCVRGLTGTGRSEYQAGLIQLSGDGETREITLRNADVRLAALCMIDPATGEQLFGMQDVDALGAKSAGALSRVVEVAQRLSAIRREDVRELTENLGPTPNVSSTSD